MDETNDTVMITSTIGLIPEQIVNPLRKLARVAMGLDTDWSIRFEDDRFLELADVRGEKKITLYKSCEEVYVRDRGVELVLEYDVALNEESFKAFVEHVRQGAIFEKYGASPAPTTN